MAVVSEATSKAMLLVSLVVMTSWRMVNGHGYLAEPPSRSSMWRYGFPTEQNYDDNGLNCGGVNDQWYVNHGKCGVCGDPWSQPPPRDNEAGGRFGKGIITRHYTPGQVIDVKVIVTANHRGWFEFRLCVHNSPTTPITQDCLNQHLLELADGSGTRYQLSPMATYVDAQLVLPAGVTCTQCVLQWKWHAGNSWGNVQEEFYGCSDVAIGGAAATQPPVVATTAKPVVTHHVPHTTPSTAVTTASTTAPPIVTAPPTPSPTTGVTGVCHAIGDWQGVPNLELYCKEQCPLGNCPPLYCSCSGSATTAPPPKSTLPPATTAPPPKSTAPPPTTTVKTAGPSTTNSSSSLVCYATGKWQGSAMLDEWCRENCAKNLCPADTCQCDARPSGTSSQKTTTRPTTPQSTSVPQTQSSKAPTLVCHAVGSWQGMPALDLYCNEQCPFGNCPPQCSCSAGAAQTTPTAAVPTAAPVTAGPAVNQRRPTAHPLPTVTKPSLALSCVAIGSWQGDAARDQWCNDHCPIGVCPSQNCRCGPETSPTASAGSGAGNPCRATGVWAGQPLLDQWCKQTCIQYSGCDPQYCTCLPATSPATTKPTTSSAVICYAINGWAGSLDLDHYCNMECKDGGPCPPLYCTCAPGPTAKITASPANPAQATASPLLAGQQNACHGINSWQGVAELDDWCRRHCAAGDCPSTYCSCLP